MLHRINLESGESRSASQGRSSGVLLHEHKKQTNFNVEIT